MHTVFRIKLQVLNKGGMVVSSIVFSLQQKEAGVGNVLAKSLMLSGNTVVTGSISPREPRQAESVSTGLPVGRSDSRISSHQRFSKGVESADLQRKRNPDCRLRGEGSKSRTETVISVTVKYETFNLMI